jgi:hypothetical protein
MLTSLLLDVLRTLFDVCHALQYLQPSLASGEILRRTMWGLFRLEWEHLHTLTQHRALECVPASSAASMPTLIAEPMSGAKVLMEVGVLVVIVLCIGTTAALTAN